MKSDRTALARRLKAARGEAGLTQEQVADYLGIRRPAIPEIEAGKRAVKSTELVRLAELYGKSIRWFVQGTEAAEDKIAAALFRAGEPTSPMLRREAAKLARLCRLVGDLEKDMGLRHHHERLPQYRREDAVEDYTQATEHAREVAYQERARLGIGPSAPIRDVWGLVEDAGLHVFQLFLGRDTEIDGVFTRVSDSKACVGVNVDKWVFRQTFTVVHEYAHALFDGDLIGEACATSRAWQRSASTRQYANREMRANQFAAVFLVPREGLLRYLGSRERVARERGKERARELTAIDVIRGQDHFGVSADMLLWRLRNEDLIDAAERKRLKDDIERSGGVIALARMLGYNWRDRAQPMSRTQELALKGFAKGLVSLGILAELFDRGKEDMSDLLCSWGVTPRQSADDALVGSVG
jgi:Zn-dependent peptidase ImmA (M78 family)/transcriptional regulator with XRE-family HTH domain